MRSIRALLFLGLGLIASGCNCGRTNLAVNAPYIEVTPLALDFGPIPVTLSAGLPIAISNLGQKALTIQPVLSDSTDFTGPTEPIIVSPGGRTTIEITFSPTAEGARNGQIRLVNDAENDPDLSMVVAGIGIPRVVCVDCNQPPPNYCSSEKTLVVYEPNGTCVNSQCQYKASTVACGDTCLADARVCTDATGGGAGGGSGGGGTPETGGGNGGGSPAGGGSGGGSPISTWAQKAYLKASNTAANDHFGLSVISNDGNTIAIAARDEDSSAAGVGGNQADNGATDSGAVYIFVRSGASWVQQAYLKASNTDSNDSFGTAIALSADGNTLAVSADSEASAATGVNGSENNNDASYSGAVYVFIRSGTKWSQQAYIKASNTEAKATDWFGSNVALSADGNTLAIGATGEDSNATGINGNQADNSAQQSGAVYVFVSNAGNWTQQAYIKPSNTQAYYRFCVVGLSGDGNTLAVGAYQLWFGQNVGPGVVYVFNRSISTWSEQTILTAPYGDMFDAFGAQVALSNNGETLAVAASAEGSNATGVNGDQTNNAAVLSGAVYVWARTGTVWNQSYLKASNTEKSDSFGVHVAVSGDGTRVAVGAYQEDSKATGINGNQGDNSASKSGAAYVFVRSGSSWVQEAYVKASNAETNDSFGIRVALDDLGKTLVVGATGESSKATGINGNQADNGALGAGAAYVFER